MSGSSSSFVDFFFLMFGSSFFLMRGISLKLVSIHSINSLLFKNLMMVPLLFKCSLNQFISSLVILIISIIFVYLPSLYISFQGTNAFIYVFPSKLYTSTLVLFEAIIKAIFPPTPAIPLLLSLL